MTVWFILAFCASALWGLNYVLSQYALKFLNPMALFFITSFLGCITMGSYMLITHQIPDLYTKISTNSKLLFAVVTYAIIYVLASILILKSINLGNASLAAMVESSYPLFTAVFAWLILKKIEFNWPMVIGAGFIITGLVIIQVASRSLASS